MVVYKPMEAQLRKVTAEQDGEAGMSEAASPL